MKAALELAFWLALFLEDPTALPEAERRTEGRSRLTAEDLGGPAEDDVLSLAA